jgi:hypothetical protein
MGLQIEALEARDLLSTYHINADWVRQAAGRPIILDQPDSQYILDVNLDVPGTALVVAAPGITLDLNGHQVVYGDDTPTTVPNGSFEDGLTAWDLNRARDGRRVPAIPGMWGQWMLQFSHFTTPQTLVSGLVTIPTVGHEYAAAITPKGTYGTTVRLSVIDAWTNQVLGSGTSPNPERGFAAVATFTPTTSHPVRLIVDLIPTGTADMALDYASVTASRDYGIVATQQWSGELPSHLLTPAFLRSYRTATNFTVRNGSVIQGQAHGRSSSPLYLNSLPGFTVTGVTATINGMDTDNLDASWGSDGTVTDSVFQGSTDRLSDRMHVTAAIALANFSGRAVITGNQIANVPQAGIFYNGMPAAQSLVIDGNDIAQAAIVTDGYGIILAGARSFDIGNNVIAPVKGRGILLDGWGRIPTEDGVIHDNDVHVYEEPNLEYGAVLEATALRVRNDDSTQRALVVRDNIFSAVTGPGGVYGAIAVRWTGQNDHGQEDGADNLLIGNTLKAIVETDDPRYHAIALAVSRVEAGTGTEFDNNLLISNDTALTFGDNDTWQDHDEDITLAGNTICRSEDGASRDFTSILAGAYRMTVADIRMPNTYLRNGAPARIDYGNGTVSDFNVEWLVADGSCDSAQSGVPLRRENSPG